MIFIMAILAVIVLLFIALKVKRLKVGNLALVTGGVKTGKTQLCVALSVKRYKKHLRQWRWKCLLARLFHKPAPEKPLYYSNMPVGYRGFEYVPLTLDLVTRQKRFAYKSVVYFNEASLLAGSKDIRDEEINDTLLHLFKLCAHETRGGYFFIDTQSPQDIHYTIKRSLSTYLNIYSRVTLPFVSLLWVRENLLVDGENTVAVDTMQDPQDSTGVGGKPFYFMVIRNHWWKWYDRYAYSSLTDDLDVSRETVKAGKNKKIGDLVRLKGSARNGKKW